MNRAFPEIPATATEAYLEKLAQKIYTRLDITDNEEIKKRLRLLLETVEERKQQLIEQTKTFESDAQETRTRTPLDILKTTKLSTEQQEVVKARLENVLADIRDQRSPSPQETLTRSLPPTSLETDLLTEQEYELVKHRMAEMLAEIGAHQHTAEQDSTEEEVILELGEDLEIGENRELTQDDELFELGPEQEIDQDVEAFLDAQEFDTLEFSAATTQNEQQTAPERETYREELEPDADEQLSFEAACRRIGKGEALVLFDRIKISPREELMVEAFKEHLTQMKGLKRQQVFDMQHLTSRSIRELEQIFKTYHLQGYLRAELNNIYNRLLNLRSRFSILQH
ncbi:hypothetical protein CSA56_03800 [candidate division KSB3 bacterium]|uniref:Uncharacterized protein n=1 Tax=candidate division KSB3 bacterium TaxID=2044937 RepID=A0A2G6KIN5_9BACT|nr:MAG: hypothetical protein CSA56_03800 [candidate division KSB3 bacterium]